jgi:hypothetical protein
LPIEYGISPEKLVNNKDKTSNLLPIGNSGKVPERGVLPDKPRVFRFGSSMILFGNIEERLFRERSSFESNES